ncbi:MAG: DNA replication/repair protein RecF [Pseudomonadota bacterium]
MALTRLTLSQFRNYASLRLDLEPRPVVLTGANGAGKTNLLEAISMLAPGRGLRSAPFAELVRAGGDEPSRQWGVAAELLGPEGETKLGTSWTDPEFAGGNTAGRQVKIDGVLQKSSGALSRHVRVTWLTPSMDRLFTGPAADRRRFLDRLVLSFDPDHGTRVQTFEKVMRERNRLLEQGGSNAAWLSGLEHQMAEAGIAIAAARSAAVNELAALLARTGEASESGHFPWVEISLDGELERQISELPAVEVEEKYRRMLAESRAQDAAAGRTLHGPHRSDLNVVHGPKGIAASYCSTGEQKALLVGIVLAHARVIRAAFEGFAPLLLLDEISAHLDESRRNGLFDELMELGAQAWMTGTDLSLFSTLGDRAQYLAMDDGSVKRN